VLCCTSSHSTTYSRALPNVVNMFTFGRQAGHPAQRHYFIYQWAHCHKHTVTSHKHTVWTHTTLITWHCSAWLAATYRPGPGSAV
jgi:hypothetical protein